MMAALLAALLRSRNKGAPPRQEPAISSRGSSRAPTTSQLPWGGALSPARWQASSNSEPQVILPPFLHEALTRAVTSDLGPQLKHERREHPSEVTTTATTTLVSGPGPPQPGPQQLAHLLLQQPPPAIAQPSPAAAQPATTTTTTLLASTSLSNIMRSACWGEAAESVGSSGAGDSLADRGSHLYLSLPSSPPSSATSSAQPSPLYHSPVHQSLCSAKVGGGGQGRQGEWPRHSKVDLVQRHIAWRSVHILDPTG